MLGNFVQIVKNDVSVSTNGDHVNIAVAPFDQKGKNAEVRKVTLAYETAVRLRDALDAFLKLDSTE